ncbi:uncharacterized protein LOC144543878 [Carex rostrata]
MYLPTAVQRPINLLPHLPLPTYEINVPSPQSFLNAKTSKGNMLPPARTIQARYRLVFSNKVTKKTFTSHPIDPIEVAIYDTCIKSNISSECFLSSAKVRLTVLRAEPWENKGDNWSRNEFNKSVLSAREGKAPILAGGSLTIRLKNGLGTFGNIIFTDNSSWSNRMFRLGVMVEGGGEEGFLNGERVLEGVSESIRVLDRRGKASQKPDQLKLTHSVQSIRKVANIRASILQKKNIKTVEDFLWWYHNNQSELREILGVKSEYDRSWKSMIEHVMKCANEFHAKYNSFEVSMSNSDYVGPLSPCKKVTIKFILKFITFLAGFRRRARMVPPAQYQPLENTSQPQQDLVHLNAGPHFVGSGSSEPNPFENYIIDGVMRAMCMQNIREIQHFLFHETNALVHPMGRNMSLYTNDGPHVVGLGSSEPDPHDNDRIEESDIYKQFSAICGNFSMNVTNEHISTASGEHIAGTQHPLYPETNALVHPMRRNMSLCTNGGPPVVGSGLSEPNPGDMPANHWQFSEICEISSMNVLNEHISTASVEYIVETQHPPLHETSNYTNVERRKILNGNSVQHTNGGGSPQLELSSDVIPMEYLDTADAESTPNYFMEFSLRSDDFECFTGSMTNNVDVGPPLTPRKKRKLMAFVRSVAFLGVRRKRARIVPLANQMTVPAI